MGRRRRRRELTESLPDAVFSQPLTVRLIRHSFEDFSPLREVEDRREYHPDEDFRAARTVWGHPVQPNVIQRPPRGRPYRSPFHKVRFAVPEKTAVCVRRETRREVLFAKKRGGGGARKRPHRNWLSEISCKRR